jgi:hypothetical protein
MSAKETSVLKGVVSFLKDHNPFHEIHHNVGLRTEIKKRINERFYVKPQQYEIDFDNQSFKYHYVPYSDFY